VQKGVLAATGLVVLLPGIHECAQEQVLNAIQATWPSWE